MSGVIYETTRPADFNMVVLAGRLANEPELREFDSGTRLVRYLVTCRLDHPRARVDVVPVTYWDPPLSAYLGHKGQRIWLVGTVQRRYWESPDGRRARLEVVAERVTLLPEMPDDGEEE